jgi:two-component sensor histidine kinase
MAGVHLTVEDRGCGQGTALSGEGLGTRLIAAIVRQLDGRADWEDARPGTRFSLRFMLCAG